MMEECILSCETMSIAWSTHPFLNVGGGLLSVLLVYILSRPLIREASHEASPEDKGILSLMVVLLGVIFLMGIGGAIILYGLGVTIGAAYVIVDLLLPDSNVKKLINRVYSVIDEEII